MGKTEIVIKQTDEAKPKLKENEGQAKQLLLEPEHGRKF